MKEFQEMVNKINEAMAAVQNLHLQPTEVNCGNIMKALTRLREIADIGSGMAQKIGEMEKTLQEHGLAKEESTQDDGAEEPKIVSIDQEIIPEGGFRDED